MTTPCALITGGTSGIGLATAELLAERGYRVMVTGRSPDGLAAARDRLGPDAAVVAADAAVPADAARLADEVRNRFGHLDGLLLNAGIVHHGPIEQTDEATFDRLFATNTRGAYFTLQKVLPLMPEGASVVFTVGLGVHRGLVGGSLTTASRGALLAMVPSLALELAPRRIRVNAMSPGAIETPIWNRMGATPEAVTANLEAMAQRIPFGRLGTARETAGAVAFLFGEDSTYVTGQHLVVAGGFGS